MGNDYFKTDEAGEQYAGDHILLDIWGGIGFTDKDFLSGLMSDAAFRADADVITSHYHSFGEGQGVTGVTMLSESHISIHTWPEKSFAALDIFMCGKSDPFQAMEHILTMLSPEQYLIRVEKRGANPDRKAWGQHLSLDLKGCPNENLCNPVLIKAWCADLIDKIEMKAYGEPILEHFATHSEDAEGYTLMQMIETSAITAHFAENLGQAYIDVFSCKPFDNKTVMDLCKNYFNPLVIAANNKDRG